LFGAFLKFSFDISSKLLHNDLFKKNTYFQLEIDRPIFGFHWYIDISQNGRFCQPQ